ncbi:MAG TPA: methyltransferase domain-containing protein [Cytophagales bacterium]|nr:methyltransferase domain-containing protein [Cytophagales bacterium]
MEDLICKIATFPQNQILEIGTGKGQFIPTLKKLAPHYGKIIAVDPNEAFIFHAKKIFAQDGSVEFWVMDPNHTSFEDHSFDIIAMSNVLHHLPPHNQVFQELKRLLKPEGLVIVVELYCDGAQSEQQHTHILQHHFRAEVDSRKGIFHDFTFQRQKIIDMLLKNGLEILNTEDYNDEERMNSRNGEFYDDVVNGITKTIGLAETFPFKHAYVERGNEILQRIKEVGFMMPTQLVAIAQFRD